MSTGSQQSTLDPNAPAERITFRAPRALLEDLEEISGDDGRYANRSEAIRSAIRDLVDDEIDDEPNRGDRW